MQFVTQGCHGCSACGHGVVVGASKEVLDLWNEVKKTKIYRRGDILFREGDPSSGIYCSFSGLIKLYRTSLDGEVRILRLVRGMHVMGHRSLLCDEPVNCTAEVIQEAQICFVDRATMLKCMAMDSRLSTNLARLLAGELARAEELVFSASCLSTRARLARLLLEISSGQGWALELTRAEIGQMTGSSPESISRALHDLAREGTIVLEKRRILVRDRERLEQESRQPVGGDPLPLCQGF